MKPDSKIYAITCPFCKNPLDNHDIEDIIEAYKRMKKTNGINIAEGVSNSTEGEE